MKFKTHLVAFFTMILLLSGCSDSNQVTRNIRVIAQAEVDGKLVEGSAVMGIRWQAGRNGRMYIKSNSEPVILDLSTNKTVYILDVFMSDKGLANTGYWPYLVLRTLGIKGQGTIGDFNVIKNASGRYPVLPLVGQPKTLPLMVSFLDEKLFETMFEVKPNQFIETFGSNVSFLGLWFEFTNEPATEAIAKRLPVAVVPNESFYSAFPKKDANGKRISASNKAFPYKFGKFGFKKKEF